MFVSPRLCLGQCSRLTIPACPPTADVLTIENSRSGDEMIAALAAYGYSRDLGVPPGSGSPDTVTLALLCDCSA